MLVESEDLNADYVDSVEAQKERFDAVYTETDSFQKVIDSDDRDRLLDSMMPKEISNKLKKGYDQKYANEFLLSFTKNAESQLWPLVKRIVVHGKFPLLCNGMTLVDIPGSGDESIAMQELANNIAKGCTYIMHVSEVKQAKTNAAVRLAINCVRAPGCLVFNCFDSVKLDNPTKLKREFGLDIESGLDDLQKKQYIQNALTNAIAEMAMKKQVNIKNVKIFYMSAEQYLDNPDKRHDSSTGIVELMNHLQVTFEPRLKDHIARLEQSIQKLKLAITAVENDQVKKQEQSELEIEQTFNALVQKLREMFKAQEKAVANAISTVSPDEKVNVADVLKSTNYNAIRYELKQNCFNLNKELVDMITESITNTLVSQQQEIYVIVSTECRKFEDRALELSKGSMRVYLFLDHYRNFVQHIKMGMVKFQAEIDKSILHAVYNMQKSVYSEASAIRGKNAIRRIKAFIQTKTDDHYAAIITQASERIVSDGFLSKLLPPVEQQLVLQQQTMDSQEEEVEEETHVTANVGNKRKIDQVRGSIEQPRNTSLDVKPQQQLIDALTLLDTPTIFVDEGIIRSRTERDNLPGVVYIITSRKPDTWRVAEKKSKGAKSTGEVIVEFPVADTTLATQVLAKSILNPVRAITKGDDYFGAPYAIVYSVVENVVAFVNQLEVKSMYGGKRRKVKQ